MNAPYHGKVISNAPWQAISTSPCRLFGVTGYALSMTTALDTCPGQVTDYDPFAFSSLLYHLH